MIPDLQKEVSGLFAERLNELQEVEEIEVEERFVDGVPYLVDENENIINEDGEVIGNWPPHKSNPASI